MNIHPSGKHIFFICIILGQLSNTTVAQKKRIDLEKEKHENQLKIQETNRILDETRNKKTVTLGQLNVITQQIYEKNKQITTFEKQIRIIDYDIYKIEGSISHLGNHLEALKAEYAAMIYNASKANDAYSKLIFLFSSQTFNQLIMRIEYFKYYSRARMKHIEQIKKVTGSLNNKREILYKKRRERFNVVNTVRSENENLSGLKMNQESVVSQLSQKENELLYELEERKKALKKLEKLITDLIKKEMDKAAAEVAAAAASNKKAKKSLIEADYLSTHFYGNKSKLIWPVQHGFISQRFGKRPHSVLLNVMVENLGVDIQTNKNEKVRSVFDGKVMAVSEVPGMNNIIMIQHGEYYTFYAKLKSTNVKINQLVKTKDIIGEVYTDANEVTEIQFQIWKNNEKQNPEEWLLNR